MTCSSYSQFAPWRKKSQKSTSGTLCSILTIIALQRLKMRFDICGEESKELVLWLFLEETISFNGLILVQHGFDALNNAYTESPHITCCLSKMWERHFALISMKSAQEQKESNGFNRRSDEDAVLESNFNDIFCWGLWNLYQERKSIQVTLGIRWEYQFQCNSNSSSTCRTCYKKNKCMTLPCCMIRRVFMIMLSFTQSYEKCIWDIKVSVVNCESGRKAKIFKLKLICLLNYVHVFLNIMLVSK